MLDFSTIAKAAGGIATVTFTGLTLTATPAQAAGNAVVSVVQAGQARFDAAAGQANNLHITAAGRVVTFDDDLPIGAGTGCSAVAGDTTVVTCDLGAAPLALGLVVNAGDGDDEVYNDSAIGVRAAGGAGNDLLRGSQTASDTLDGGAGDDELIGAEDPFAAGSAGDAIRGGDGNDQLSGASGNDVLNGGAGDDNLYGNDGDDSLLGGNGDDQLIGGQGADLHEGGAGQDGAYYTERDQPVRADLDNVQGDDGEAGEGDSLVNVEDIFGSTGDDVLTGDDENNILDGGPGKDTLSGLGGDDQLIGGLVLDGPDALDGGDNGTDKGDTCQLSQDGGTTVNCETVIS